MPKTPRYTRKQAAAAVAAAGTWAEALRLLGVSPRGKNFATLRKWAARWKVDASHLPAYRPRQASPRFSEAEAREAIATSSSWAEALRRLDYCPSGGNPRTLKRWASRWAIPTDHFDPHAASIAGLTRPAQKELSEVLIERSTYHRGRLKERLYEEGLKRPVCELCGQGEVWKGRRMSLILDHANGVRNDYRIENLRIVCPNCAATLSTHCGRKHPARMEARECARCGRRFQPKYRDHRYCSRACGIRWARGGREPGDDAKPDD